jgi:probable rRNA maturation factor
VLHPQAKPQMKARRNGAPSRTRVSAASRRRRAQRVQTVPPRIEIIVASPLWKAERGLRLLLRRAVREAAAAAATNSGELAIVLTDDSAIRVLNRDWRGHDRPTNVLSFPAHAAATTRAPAGADRLLGDIVIAYETMAREARAQHRPFAHHLAHLAVHGFLHLVGHDHAADAEAQAMEALEVAVLARLKVPNPYLAPDC